MTYRLLPAKVDRVTGDVKAIAAPKLGNYSLALMADGTVMSWGRNDEGQLGRGDLTSTG